MKNYLLPLLMTLILTGCSVYRIDSKDTTQDFYPPKNSIEDVSYMETVTEPYQEIGIVSVTTQRRHSLEEILPKLKQEAAILGGDVITDIQSNAGGIWQNVKLQKYIGNGYIHTTYTAKVLVLK